MFKKVKFTYSKKPKPKLNFVSGTCNLFSCEDAFDQLKRNTNPTFNNLFTENSEKPKFFKKFGNNWRAHNETSSLFTSHNSEDSNLIFKEHDNLYQVSFISDKNHKKPTKCNRINSKIKKIKKKKKKKVLNIINKSAERKPDNVFNICNRSVIRTPIYSSTPIKEGKSTIKELTFSPVIDTGLTSDLSIKEAHKANAQSSNISDLLFHFENLKFETPLKQNMDSLPNIDKNVSSSPKDTVLTTKELLENSSYLPLLPGKKWRRSLLKLKSTEEKENRGLRQGRKSCTSAMIVSIAAKINCSQLTCRPEESICRNLLPASQIVEAKRNVDQIYNVSPLKTDLILRESNPFKHVTVRRKCLTKLDKIEEVNTPHKYHSLSDEEKVEKNRVTLYPRTDLSIIETKSEFDIKKGVNNKSICCGSNQAESARVSLEAELVSHVDSKPLPCREFSGIETNNNLQKRISVRRKVLKSVEDQTKCILSQSQLIYEEKQPSENKEITDFRESLSMPVPSSIPEKVEDKNLSLFSNISNNPFISERKKKTANTFRKNQQSPTEFEIKNKDTVHVSYTRHVYDPILFSSDESEVDPTEISEVSQKPTTLTRNISDESILSKTSDNSKDIKEEEELQNCSFQNDSISRVQTRTSESDITSSDGSEVDPTEISEVSQNPTILSRNISNKSILSKSSDNSEDIKLAEELQNCSSFQNSISRVQTRTSESDISMFSGWDDENDIKNLLLKKEATCQPGSNESYIFSSDSENSNHSSPESHHSSPGPHHSSPELHHSSPELHHSSPELHHFSPENKLVLKTNAWARNSSVLVPSSDYSPDKGDLDENIFLESRIGLSQMWPSDENEVAFGCILHRCGQIALVNFSDAFPDKDLTNSKKVGEGVYGEVFLVRRTSDPEDSVVKIIPVQGDQIVNGEVQKKYNEIISELIISQELSLLRDTEENFTDSFCKVKKIWCLQGQYPHRLQNLWDEYNKRQGSDNDSPKMFKDNQQYIVLDLEHGGQPLESYKFTSAKQAYSVFLQTAFALAVGEVCLEFEHRDLHWGNVLVKRTQEKYARFKVDDHIYYVPTSGVKATIIDYTLSRIFYAESANFNDLSMDPDMFKGTGDYQFDIYRIMQQLLCNDWSKHEPQTNIKWLDYMLDKLIKNVSYASQNSIVHRTHLKMLEDLRCLLKDFYSAFDYIDYLGNTYCPTAGQNILHNIKVN